MATVFQMNALPDKGSAPLLGPVTVSAKYPAKQTSNGKWMRTIQVSDASGTTKLTLWGSSAQLPLTDGSTVIFKGNLKCNEYNGTKGIAAEGVTIEPADGSAPASGGPAIGQPAHAGPASSKDQQIMRQNALAHATALVVASGVGASVFDAQRTVLELAEVFAKYSETGETGSPSLPDAPADYIPE